MKYIVEMDASGQEARLMAELSQDAAMLNIFRTGGDFHSYTGSAISDIPYEEFMRRKAAGDPTIVGEQGLRYCGKFVGLSNQYRIGAKKSRIQARIQYGLDKDIHTIRNWQKAYHRAYPGVKRYWKQAIRLAKEKGYSETLAGQRFYIHAWSGDTQWASESSAINHPIQGSGGAMKELALAMVTAKFPQLEFLFDLHDGEHWLIDSKHLDANMQVLYDVRELLNNLPYSSAWGWTPSIPMTWDCAIGTDWASMKELQWDEKGLLITN